MSLTLLIIIGTVVISVLAFKNYDLFDRLKFNPYLVFHKKEYARIIGHGFLHADYGHLAFNMITLWFFGGVVEQYFQILFNNGRVVFVLFYLFAMAVATVPTLLKHKNDYGYNSVGASGAVSAVLFASIYFEPFNDLIIFPIPFPIPAIVFGVAYLAYSYYQSKKAMDNINHDAHFVGAIFGFLFPILLKPSSIVIFLDKF